MRHGASLVTALLALGAAALVFQVKATVRELEREIARTGRALETARWRLQTLNADHAYLARPERLALQAQQLGLVPATASRMVGPDAIALALPPDDPARLLAEKVVPVTLPSGERLELRFKPAAGGRVLAAAAAPGVAR